MRKLEFFFQTKRKRDAVRQFYRSLGLKTSTKSKALRISETSSTKILSVTQSRIYLRAKEYASILESHKNSQYDLETECLEKDVVTNSSHLPHHIPTRITLADPLSNTLCIFPSLTPKLIAVLTSGGDAPGMNAVIWAIVRTAKKNGAKVLGVRNGYSGLLADEMEYLSEEMAFRHMYLGGTFLGSARAKELPTELGMQKVSRTLRERDINSLIVIGGDGSMRGALAIAQNIPSISVVFIPASIDNDIPGTLSLGAPTALHRIVESIDCIESTMASHRRGFVLEVMGRACGWLGLVSAFSSDASYVLLPEFPPDPNWKEHLQKKLQEKKKKCSYAILSEGASCNGRKIEAEEVRQAMEIAGVETRTVILGHTQRGGSPCATDRVIAPILGVAAAEVALSKAGSHAVQISGFKETIIPLEQAVDSLKNRSKDRQFEQMYREVLGTRLDPQPNSRDTICVSVVGVTSPGAEKIVANLEKMSEKREIRIKRADKYFQHFQRKPEEQEELKQKLKKYSTLVLIGGLDAVAEAKRLKGVCRRLFVLPCTVSNNVPGTDVSIGADTALDTITALCDNLKVSGAKRVAYIVEVFGGACGYLSVASALATGSLDCYFPEEVSAVQGLSRSVKALKRYFKKRSSPQLIIRGNGAVRGVCSETAARVLEADGHGDFSVRSCALGHIQKGNRPTAMDRYRAAQLALGVFAGEEGEWVIGVSGEKVIISSLPEMESLITPGKRRVKKPSWIEAARTYRVLR